MFAEEDRNSYFGGVEIVRSYFQRFLYQALSLSVEANIGSLLGATNQRRREQVVARAFRGLITDSWDPLESTCRHASLSIL